MPTQSPPEKIRVPIVDEAEATGRVKELYDQTLEQMNLPFVPDIVLIFSSRPEFLNVAVQGVTTLFTRSTLPRPPSSRARTGESPDITLGNPIWRRTVPTSRR